MTRERVNQLIDLNVSEQQQQFVATNAVTLAQAAYEPSAQVCGLWRGETAVGLMAWVDMSHPQAPVDPGDKLDCLFLWRLMIHLDHQRSGAGKAALAHLAQLAKALGRSSVFVSVVEGPGGPLNFYESNGFVRTGKISEGETVLSLAL